MPTFPFQEHQGATSAAVLQCCTQTLLRGSPAWRVAAVWAPTPQAFHKHDPHLGGPRQGPQKGMIGFCLIPSPAIFLPHVLIPTAVCHEENIDLLLGVPAPEC